MNKKKQNITFIVNPKAGVTVKSKLIINLLTGKLMPSRFIAKVFFTEYAGHAEELAQQAITSGADVIVAWGGDGTINEVAKALVGTDIPMGIIPGGSGNGLARCLKLPLHIPLAFRTLAKGNTKKIDTVEANGHLFISVAGLGFDAYVAKLFAKSHLRGLLSYTKIVLKEYPNYQSLTYKMHINGEVIEKEALMVVFANSNQFGFRTKIAPKASVTDGKMDICFVEKVPTTKLIRTGMHLFNGTFGKTGYATYYRANEVFVESSKGLRMNIDGESVKLTDDVKIKLNPASLNVIVP